MFWKCRQLSKCSPWIFHHACNWLFSCCTIHLRRNAPNKNVFRPLYWLWNSLISSSRKRWIWPFSPASTVLLHPHMNYRCRGLSARSLFCIVCVCVCFSLLLRSRDERDVSNALHDALRESKSQRPDSGVCVWVVWIVCQVVLCVLSGLSCVQLYSVCVCIEFTVCIVCVYILCVG